MINFVTPTPKSVFLEARKVNLIQEEEVKIFFLMINDRNLTTHTYNEKLAEEIKGELDVYYKLMHAVMDRISLTATP